MGASAQAVGTMGAPVRTRPSALGGLPRALAEGRCGTDEPKPFSAFQGLRRISSSSTSPSSFRSSGQHQPKLSQAAAASRTPAAAALQRRPRTLSQAQQSVGGSYAAAPRLQTQQRGVTGAAPLPLWKHAAHHCTLHTAAAADLGSRSSDGSCSSCSSGGEREREGESARERWRCHSVKRDGLANAHMDAPLSADGADAQTQGFAATIHQRDEVASVGEWLDAFIRFTRPHTMIGTALSVVSVSMLAVPSPLLLSPIVLVGVLQALVPALLMNIYIVGLNQLFDIEIDKVNKPSLPLASGEFSVRTGITIVAAAAALSVALGSLSNSVPLLATLLVSMVLGTAYSVDLPLLRWKRFPVLAASCILAVRAVVVQLGFFSHMQMAVLGQPAITLTVPLVFATSFMCLFSIVIALFKDIPDVEGDRVFGVRSLSVRLGQKTVYWLCVSILLAAYTAAVAVSSQSSVVWCRVLSMALHTAAALWLWRRAQSVDLSSPSSISSVYMFVWKLFYLEYAFLPLLRL